MDIVKGQVVISKAGRDKGYFLAVTDVKGNTVTVVDGKERPLERPKQKNIRHVAVTKRTLTESQMATNRELRRQLRLECGEEG